IYSSSTAAVAATTTPAQRGQVVRVRVRVVVLFLVVAPDRAAIVRHSWSSIINTVISSSSSSNSSSIIITTRISNRIITRITSRIIIMAIISSNTITMMNSARIWGIRQISTWITRLVKNARWDACMEIHRYISTNT
ncbi:uncharacterized protein Dyak_GE28175, partial [Drosophila yakuba]